MKESGFQLTDFEPDESFEPFQNCSFLVHTDINAPST